MKKGISLVVVLVMLVVAMLAFAGEKAKIAVAANDKMPSAAVSKQAGPAPFFQGKGSPVADSAPTGIH